MQDMDGKLTEFYGRSGAWHEPLAELRTILRTTSLTEEFKWNAPCYCFQGGNVVTVWAMKDVCALAFFKGALLSDPEGTLIAPGANSRAMRRLDFADRDQITRSRPMIDTYLAEAIELERSGRRVDFARDDLPPPEELVAAFEEDEELRAAFEALTPGRRRGYLLHFSEPKQVQTRISRIDKARSLILTGRGLHDR